MEPGHQPGVDLHYYGSTQEIFLANSIPAAAQEELERCRGSEFGMSAREQSLFSLWLVKSCPRQNDTLPTYLMGLS